MLTKSNPEEIESFLSDASHMLEGQAERVVFPENAEEVAEILRKATANATPVTISGAGTGTVGVAYPSRRPPVAPSRCSVAMYRRCELNGIVAVRG